MAVQQTRQHFLQKYGKITDNPLVGEDMCSVYWRCGNSESFLDLVHKMTGSPLSGAAIVGDLKETVEDRIRNEKSLYENALKSQSAPANLNDLKMRIIVVHGSEEIADSEKLGSIEKTSDQFRAWVRKNYF